MLREAKFLLSLVVELLNTTALYDCPAPPSQSSLQASSMAPRRTVTGKEAMASRRAAFLAARDRTHGKEAMASRRAEFIIAGSHIVTWADFEAAMDESSQEKRVPPPQEKRGRTPWEESFAEIEARWAATYKAGKENAGVWPACLDGSM